MALDLNKYLHMLGRRVWYVRDGKISSGNILQLIINTDAVAAWVTYICIDNLQGDDFAVSSVRCYSRYSDIAMRHEFKTIKNTFSQN